MNKVQPKTCSLTSVNGMNNIKHGMPFSDITFPSFAFPCFTFMATLLFSLMIIPSASHASEYSPPGLYDVEQLTLENGLDVILKTRPGANTFSLRIWAGIGTQDFPCKQQETPHFLEHLLFTGTSKHTETELEHLVADHGGSWNAATGDEETTYKMDIYSRYAAFAIDTLYEIMTDSSITEENVETSRDIIHREAGGRPSAIKQWFRLHGFGVNATEKAARQLLPGSNFICDAYVTADGISRDDIIDTFEKYYVPANMALIAVGNFDKQQVIEQIQKTFGSITKKPVTEKNKPALDTASSYEAVTGTFSPLLSDDANIGVIYRIPGYWSDDHYPLMVIEEYLYFKINETIRIDRGLSYAPGTWSYATSKFGLFGAHADVGLEDTEEALNLIKTEMRELAERPMNAELLEKSKLKILLQSVQGYESNASIADYYTSQYVLFRKDRFYENIENKIEAVTTDDINRIVQQHLTEDKAVTILETPTLTYTQLYIVLSLFSIITLFAIIAIYLRTHRHHLNKKYKR